MALIKVIYVNNINSLKCFINTPYGYFFNKIHIRYNKKGNVIVYIKSGTSPLGVGGFLVIFVVSKSHS